MFIILIISKIVWIIVGVILFCFKLKGHECGGNVSNYLLIYFTQALLVGIEGARIFIHGKIKKSKMIKKYKDMKEK
jgi:hypothetical protein